MKIEDITKGMTLYHKKVDNTQRRRDKVYHHPVVIYKYFVVDVNRETNIIMASLNGAPAQPYPGNKYARWTKEKPALE